jgi:hypothetical protein
VKCLFVECGEDAWRRYLCRDHYRFAREDGILNDFPTVLAVRRVQALRAQYVYVMRSKGLYKIGKTQCLTTRQQALESEMSAPVDLVYCFRCDNALKVEARAHKILASCRVRGEWFACSQQEAATAINEAAAAIF